MRNLQKKLEILRNDHNLVGVKGGTEVEAMSFEEIYQLRRISHAIVPMTVKIGGPEACNDIVFMLENQIDCILAPMVESPYALKNFVQTMAKLAAGRPVKLAVNIETISAFYRLNEIFDSPFFREIHQVTVGRSDLSGSMEKHVDDDEVLRVTREIVEMARTQGKITSVGGALSVDNSLIIQKKLNSDYINSRHMTIRLNSSTIEEDVRAALNWEKEFYSFLSGQFPNRRSFYEARIGSVKDRMSSSAKQLHAVK